MKRILVALTLAFLPAILLAQVADRDVLLTHDGTLYTVESTVNNGAAPAGVSWYLNLTIQRGNNPPQTMIVPDSLTAGMHWRPALAYDDDSQTLFVFWLKMPNAMSSELLLASYSNGRWQPAFSIDNQPYHLRYNLRIAITRSIAQLQSDNSYADVPMLLVHAIWWEQTGYGEYARYAMIPITRGKANAADLHDLAEFAPTPPIFPNQVAPTFNPEILRHPAFADNGTADSIDVIFGDTYYNLFNHVTLKPISDGRIHIPIGAHPGGPRIRVAFGFDEPWTGRISTITSPHDKGSLLLYNTGSDAVHYIVFSNNAWSDVQMVPLSDKLSADAAVFALTRMMSQ